MFVDIHTHILPGMDDGAADLKKSLEMLEIAASENEGGILFATPHFICGELQPAPGMIMENCRKLEKQALINGYHLRICTGSEVFLSPEVPELVGGGEISTLNYSRYILVELPMMSIPAYTEQIVYELELMGLIPILAHPERNKEIQKNPELLYDMVTRGVLCQVNATSLKGIYGREIMKLAFLLIRNNLVHFVASDTHTSRGRSPKLRTVYDVISEEFGRDTAERLFRENGLSVYQNKTVTSPEPIKPEIQKGFFTSILSPIQKLLAR